MARKRSISVAALNIRTHPVHSAERYRSLIEDAFKLKRSVKTRGDQFMLLSFIDSKLEDDTALLGSVARFTNIDKDLPWFDADNFKEAEDDDVRKIIIPDHLKPNYVPFNFGLFPKEHLFVFETYSLGRSVSAKTVLGFITRLLSDKSLMEKYGEISVDLVADSERLKDILEMDSLKHLKITVRKPNPDDLGGIEDEVQQRLLDEHARSLTEETEATPGSSLTPTKRTKNLAKVATKNGEVEAYGKNEVGAVIRRSTIDHPVQVTRKFDPDFVPERSAFVSTARVIVQKISAAFNRP